MAAWTLDPFQPFNGMACLDLANWSSPINDQGFKAA
jgi:hypothetical protein